MSGTAIAQAIGILISPVLSRHYSPSEFGVLGTVITLSGILVSFCTLKFEMGIVQADSEEEEEGLTLLSIVSSIVILSVAYFVFIRIPGFLETFGIDILDEDLIFLTVVLGFFLSVDRIMVQWSNNRKAYALLSQKTVVGKLSTSVFQLIWAFTIASGIGLAYGNLFGATLGLIIVARPFLLRKSNFKLRLSDFKRIASKNYRYLIYTAPQNLLNAISQGLPVFMLGRFFSDVEVGSYFFTMRILQLPSALIGGAVRQVFYKEAADLKNDIQALRKRFEKVTLILFSGILVPVVVLFFIGPDLFAYIFGDEWREAGLYASWMFLWVGLMFINPPASAMYFILNKQRTQLVYEIALFIARFGALYYFGQTRDILLTIQVYSIIGVVFNLIYIAYISIVLRNESLNRG